MDLARLFWLVFWGVMGLFAYTSIAGLVGWMLTTDSKRHGTLTGNPEEDNLELIWIQICSWLWPLTAVAWPLSWVWNKGIERLVRKGIR